MPRLEGFGDKLNIAVLGAGGGIGSALTAHLTKLTNVEHIYAISRSHVSNQSKITTLITDGYTEVDLARITDQLPDLDVALCAIGTLHGDAYSPEKTMSQMDYKSMQAVFEINAFAPAMIAKYLLPKLRQDRKTVFAALSARVGSISDNRLGGWYSYRASKAALNMMLKTLAIEHGRRHKKSVVIGLHPGTVDTQLSRPFQVNVPEEKLFSADFSAARLLDVVEKVMPDESGKIFAWDGQEILP